MTKVIFNIYLWYLKLPWKIGKGFLGRFILKFGLARYQVGNIWFELNPGAWIDRLLAAGEFHDPLVSETIAKRLKHGGIFVDIGANIGVFTLTAAKMPDVFVYAFEPSPRELIRLYRNIALNKVNNVVVHPMALGRTSAQLELTLGQQDNPGTNTFVSQVEQKDLHQVVACRCEPFEVLFPAGFINQIRVVKIDVEGFEMEVLTGMSGAIKQMQNVAFVVEITRSFLKRAGSSAEDVYHFFREHGFTPHIGIQAQERWDELFSKQ